MADLSDQERQDLSELLPFYLNGTLEGADLENVEDGLARDELLRADLEFLKVVQAQTLSRDIKQTPGEFGLARLMRDIDAETKLSAPVAPVVLARDNRFWKFAAAACLALFVATSSFVVTNPDSIAELASGGVVTIHEGPVLTVAFVDSATEAQIRDLLLDLELEISSGPSALGIYTLVGTEDADGATLVAGLSAASSIVETVAEEE